MTRSIAAALLLALVAAGCGSASGRGQEGLTAVASVYPLAWLAEAIAPDAAVTFLAASGQDPHDLELSPQQRAAVDRADVALYLGPIGFQPQVEDALAGREGPVVDAAAVLGTDALLPITEHEADHEDPADGTVQEAVDPHLWFDPELMARLATATGEAFAQADPARRQQYLTNARQAADELTELDADLAALLSGCRHDEIIVSHEAYAYLVTPHGLAQHGISGAAGHTGASPQDISRLVAQIRTAEIPAVLSEPVEGRDDAETVAREAGVDLIEILSLDIVDEAAAQAGFPALLLQQAEAVAQAAECAGS